MSCTVVVLARNEAARIAACLGSAEGLDVLVLSMGSTDDTVAIAESLGARVVEVPFVEEFDRARNLASRYAETPWILFLDADERLTPRAIQRIEELLESAPEDVAAFSLPYQTISFGRWIRHAGNWWPSHKSPALVRRERFHFPGGVHEPCRIAGRIEKVLPRNDDEAIVHESHRDLSHYLEKLNRYTSLETRKEVAGKRELGWPSLARRFGSTLAWFYDETEGKRDGLAGWLLSVGSALYELSTDLKLSQTATDRAVIPPSAEAFLREASLAASGRRSSEPSWAPWLREQARCCTIVPAERDARRRPDSTLVAEVGDRLWCVDFPEVVEPSGPRALFLAHDRAMDTLGGGEVQLVRTLRALRAHGIVADLAVGEGATPESFAGADLAHVFSLHHEGRAASLAESGKPYALSPVYWDRAELRHVAPRCMAVAEHSRTLSEAFSGWRTLRREAEAMREDGLFVETISEEARRLVEGAAAILPNAAIEAEALKRSARSSGASVFVVHNAVDSTPTPDDEGVLSDLPQGPFVLCVGRLEPNKNQLGLILALKGTGAALVLIGEERYPAYARLCREWSDPSVRFLGPRSVGGVRTAMKRASAHCLVGFGETPGLANLEALACGCPLVCGDRAAELEYFGESARYANPLDLDAIRKETLETMSNPLDDEARAGLERTAAAFTWERAAAETARAYRAVLGHRER